MRSIDLYVQVLVELSKAEVVSALYVSQGEIPFIPTGSNNQGENGPEGVSGGNVNSRQTTATTANSTAAAPSNNAYI